MRWQIEVAKFTDDGKKIDSRLGIIPDEASLTDWRQLLEQLLESFKEPPQALKPPHG